MVMNAFLVGLAISLAAIAYASVQGVWLWRQAKQTGGSLSTELASFEERSARTERLLADAESSNQDLDAAIARLRSSRARLNMLLGSLETTRRRTRWFRAFVPYP